MSFLRVDFMSDALGMQTGANVIIPDKKAVCDMPVVYLLHGLSDNSTSWERRTSVERYADEKQCIVIMPEVQRSFYTDMAYGLKYFTYVADELPRIMKRLFSISNAPEQTYIAGLSMGGYGALKCALTFPSNYAGVAAFSAVADLKSTIEKEVLGNGFPISETTAIYGNECKVNPENDLFELAKKAATAKKRPRVFMACGTEDVLLLQNHALRDHLTELSFATEYQEWEDGHNWGFWDIAIQLAFDYFFDPEEQSLEEQCPE